MTTLTKDLTSAALSLSAHAAIIGGSVVSAAASADDGRSITAAIHDYNQPVSVHRQAHAAHLSVQKNPQIQLGQTTDAGLQHYAYSPALSWSQLGDSTFCADHEIRFAYMCGAMANGIASAEMVVAAAHAGILGSYGAAGQSLPAIEAAIKHITTNAPGLAFCINLIHSPNEPEHESHVVDLFLKHQIRLIEASAYLALTAAVVRYRLTGLHRNDAGDIVAPNRIIAKASRVEVATRWWNPAPQKIVDELLQAGAISQQEAELSQFIPMAQDMTAEADSGGHTDNRPALCMFPAFLALKNSIQSQHNYPHPLRIGLGGGIGSPSAAAAAYAMGAAYIVTGSINQACHESGSSERVRKMLSEVEQADVCMAPAADMFEMGVKLQVLKRGTMFPMRAEKLYTLYRTYNALDEIPAADRAQLEKQYFRKSIAEIWAETEAFFLEREPKQIEKAKRDPKHQMALVFRWYLGKSSRWANSGDSARTLDYQVWCGAAMGAFNQWTRGTFLAAPAQRSIACVAYNLLHACCVHLRCHNLQLQGIIIDARISHCVPLTTAALEGILHTHNQAQT